MTDNKDIWEIVQGELKKSQPSHAYSTWFEPIKSMGIHEGNLLLELPNQFFYDWIQSHYVETIEKFVTKEYPEKLTIKYTVAPQNPLVVEESTNETLNPKNDDALKRVRRSLSLIHI